MAKTERWPGFGERVRQRLLVLGYTRPDGNADISRFTVEKGYVVTLFYKYLANTTPSRENLLRLARDLEVSPAWLLFGDEDGAPTPSARKRRKPVPISGGSGEPHGLGVVQVRDRNASYRTLWTWLVRPLAPPMLFSYGLA